MSASATLEPAVSGNVTNVPMVNGNIPQNVGIPAGGEVVEGSSNHVQSEAKNSVAVVKQPRQEIPFSNNRTDYLRRFLVREFVENGQYPSFPETASTIERAVPTFKLNQESYYATRRALKQMTPEERATLYAGIYSMDAKPRAPKKPKVDDSKSPLGPSTVDASGSDFNVTLTNLSRISRGLGGPVAAADIFAQLSGSFKSVEEIAKAISQIATFQS